MTDFVTLIEHHFGDKRFHGTPKVQIDLDSISIKKAASHNRGVEFAISAQVKRIGFDGVERLDVVQSKDWIGIAAAWQNLQLRRKISELEFIVSSQKSMESPQNE